MRTRAGMEAAIAVAALALAGSVAGCILPPETAECASAVGCGACIGRSGCGWCVGDSVCRPGSSLGADFGVCRRDQWRYASCEGPTGPSDPCAGSSYCSTCRDDSSCGWCFDGDGACLQGTASGPSDGTCENWSYSESNGECYNLECTAEDTCGGCLEQGCYWCTAGGYCASSTQSTCDYDYEISPHGGDACPATDECYRGAGCESCTEIPGCVYCYEYDDIFERYESHGCHAMGRCPTLAEYSANEPFRCPSEL